MGKKTKGGKKKADAADVESPIAGNGEVAREVSTPAIPESDIRQRAAANNLNEDPAAAQSPSAVEDSPKTSAKKKFEKKKKPQQSYMMSPLQAAKGRIMKRFQRFLLIGYLFEKKASNAEQPKQQSKRQKEQKKKPLMEQLSDWYAFCIEYATPIIGAMVVFMIFSLKAGEEGFDSHFASTAIEEANPYTVLELSTSATSGQIKKAYKDLALKWHPDHHPNCESCDGKFAEISKAYDKIGNARNRKMFDSGKRQKQDVLTKGDSTKVTPQMFENSIRRSRDVWIIMFYDKSDSNMFPPFEEISTQYPDLVKFGHCDISEPEGADVFHKKLGQRQLIFGQPMIVRYAHGSYEVMDLIQESMSEVKQKPPITFIRSFIYNSFPVSHVPYLKSGELVNSGIVQNNADSGDRPDVVIVAPAANMIPTNADLERPTQLGGNKKNPKMLQQKIEILYLYRMAYRYQDVANFHITDVESIKEACQTGSAAFMEADKADESKSQWHKVCKGLKFFYLQERISKGVPGIDNKQGSYMAFFFHGDDFGSAASPSVKHLNILEKQLTNALDAEDKTWYWKEFQFARLAKEKDEAAGHNLLNAKDNGAALLFMQERGFLSWLRLKAKYAPYLVQSNLEALCGARVGVPRFCLTIPDRDIPATLDEINKGIAEYHKEHEELHGEEDDEDDHQGEPLMLPVRLVEGNWLGLRSQLPVQSSFSTKISGSDKLEGKYDGHLLVDKDQDRASVISKAGLGDAYRNLAFEEAAWHDEMALKEHLADEHGSIYSEIRSFLFGSYVNCLFTYILFAGVLSCAPELSDAMVRRRLPKSLGPYLFVLGFGFFWMISQRLRSTLFAPLRIFA